MSSLTSSSLTFIGQQIIIYGGLLIIIAGILGNSINIIVFLCLKTFRQSSCAFYLAIMSFVNIGQLLFGLLSRIIISGFGIDWTTTSVFFCKFRLTFLQLCSLLSYACLCLATVDQYFATCTLARWQQWSNIKQAHRFVIMSTIILSLILIPYPIYLKHVILSTGNIICFLPDLITVVFGTFAYCNIQRIAYRTVPLVRRELDKQLTTMVLVQIVINLFTNVPSVTMNAVLYATSDLTDSNVLEKIQFGNAVTLVIFYSYFASSFYIYLHVSERFRRQLIYVIRVMHLNRWRPQRIVVNQVVPA